VTNLCFVPLSCLITCNSSSRAAIRRFALASVQVGTTPERSGSASPCVALRWSSSAEDMAKGSGEGPEGRWWRELEKMQVRKPCFIVCACAKGQGKANYPNKVNYPNEDITGGNRRALKYKKPNKPIFRHGYLI